MYETHGGRLKQQFGNGLKRSIKFDDTTQSLVMDTKLPEDDEWIRLNREDIVQISREQAEKTSALNPSRHTGKKADKMRKIAMRSPKKNTIPIVDSDSESLPGSSGVA